MQNFIFLFTNDQSILITTIVAYLFKHSLFAILRSHQLVRDFDFIDSALLTQLEVLVVTDGPLLAHLQLFPCFILNHGGVCVQVLPLQLNLFKFFCESLLLLALYLLLRRYYVVHFQKSFFTSRYTGGFSNSGIFCLLFPPQISLNFTFLPCFFYLVCIFDQSDGFALFLCQILFPF